MRLVVHDYSGHPFQAQLSRELARRGHRVLHLHCPSYRSGKGSLERLPSDPDTLSIRGIDLGAPFAKYSPFRRLAQEWEYGRRLVRAVRQFGPEVVLSSNTPLFSQRAILRDCRRRGVRFVFWQQDIYSFGMQKGVAHWRWVGEPLGRLFVRTERNLLVLSDSVVTISPDFVRTLAEWGLSTERISVIENWAPLEELPHRSRQSSWSTAHGLADKTTFLYSGTLGRKHDPTLLLELAVRFRHRPDVVLVVISEGQAAEWLAVQKESLALDNLVLLPFQPYDALPDVLGSADVLVVILERDAGVFSVPSKVLTYQCAGRPLLAAVPPENLAGRIIAESECGLVFDSDDREGFLAAAEKLAADEDLRIRLGRNGRTYAEATFDIGVIADRFETVLAHVAASSFSRERPTTKLRPNG